MCAQAEWTCHSEMSQWPRWEMRLASANDVMHQKRAEDFGIFWKRQLVELRPASKEDGWLSLARGGLGQVSHEMGVGRWKSQNRKNVYLSPYVKEPLNSKVIKSFVPELRSRKCFSCFEILCIYIWTLYVHFAYPYWAMEHNRVSKSWLLSQSSGLDIYLLYRSILKHMVNQNGFRRNRSTTSQILTIRRILEGVRAKNLQATLIFVDFTKAFDSIHRGKMEQILLAYGIPKETVAAITILYRNTKVKVRSQNTLTL